MLGSFNENWVISLDYLLPDILKGDRFSHSETEY